MRVAGGFKLWLATGAATAALACASGSAAQTLLTAPATQPNPVTEPAAPAAAPPRAPLTLGPVGLDATAALGGTFTDNVFVTKNHTSSDWIGTFSSGVTAAVGDTSNRLDLRASADLGRYQRYRTENYDDFSAGADGRVRLGSATSLFGGAEYDWRHEPRESPDAVNGLVPTRYGAGDYYAGLLTSFPKFVLRAGATANTFTYRDVPSSEGVIDNAGRDRTEWQAGARLSYRLGDNLLPFVQGYWDRRDYAHAFDAFGFARSSTGQRAAVGLTWESGKSLSGEAYAGVIRQQYVDPRFRDLTTADFGGRLSWRPAAGSTVQLYAERSVEETILADASGYLHTVAGVSVDQQVRPDLFVNARLSYADNAYTNVERTDRVTEVGIGAKYFFLPRTFAGLDYARLHRVSNTADADFFENRVSLRLGVQLGRAYQPGTKFETPSLALPAGLYVGLFATPGVLISAVDGPRGSSTSAGALIADFGGSGAAIDGALGYGVDLGSIYLGVEGTAGDGNRDWLHTGTGGTRTFSVRSRDSYELAARLGYILPNRAMAYARFGGVATRFETQYAETGASADASGFRRGLRTGGGLDFPVTGHVTGRAEFTVTSYADYDLGAKKADNFANSEVLMRFGAAYHFGAAAPPAGARPAEFGGPYVGVAGGFGSLTTVNSGDRSAPRTLTADRAGSGQLAGLYAGYAVTLGRFYAAAEGGVDFSNVDWNIKRDPDRRIYSVAEDRTLSASLLGGYILPSNVLVYGRLGLAETRFGNVYRGENGGDVVRPDVDRSGLRLGAGVATPLSPRMMLRLEYSWTRYDRYAVDYLSGVDMFRNSDGVARVGLSLRF